jgi:hypothetical protein
MKHRTRLLPRLLLSLGCSVLFLAVIWWWETYREVIGYAYISKTQAGICLISDRAICTLARALCRNAHPLALIDYPPAVLWLGTLLFSGGLFLAQRAWRGKTEPLSYS